MAVAEDLNMHVYVDKTRWKAMLCYDWDKSQLGRLVTDPTAATLWVEPMNRINFNYLKVPCLLYICVLNRLC